MKISFRKTVNTPIGKMNLGKNGANSVTTTIGGVTINRNLKTGKIRKFIRLAKGIKVEL